MNSIIIIFNKKNNKLKCFLFNNKGEYLYEESIKREKGDSPDELLAYLSKSVIDDPNVHDALFLPEVCLSQTNFRFTRYTIKVNTQKIISYFEQKEYRAEKREALITIAIFLSRKIKQEILGVVLTINQLSSLLGMSTRRVSETLAELNRLNLATLITQKYNGLSLPGLILIKPDFFLTFYDEFHEGNKDQMLIEIENIKKTRIDSKTKDLIARYENPIEEYFSYLSYMAELKNELFNILRAKGTHDKVKEHIYLLLNLE